jgi:predicted ATP-binding protein involved in virulence
LENIVDIHEAVYDFLEEYREQEIRNRRAFHYTFRRSNQKNKLDEGFWFYGNDNYLAVSFWSGMDWKNKTPNIFFRITNEGRTFLTITTKDSIRKAESSSKYFVKPLELNANGKDRWTKEFQTTDYIKSLQKFLGNEKIIIDRIINENAKALISEDESNSLGFIIPTEFEKWFENVKYHREDGGLNKFPFSLTTFSVEKYVPIESANFNRISKNTPFIIIVGENGSGKSSLLKALATALGNKYYEENHAPDNSPWLINFSLSIRGKTKRFKISSFEPKLKNDPNVPFACFGPSRLVINNRSIRTTLNEAGKDKTSPLWSLFYPDGILKDINRWLINKLAEKETKNNKENSKLIFENIKQMLIDTVPRLYDIREVPWDNTQELLYFEEDLNENKIEKGVIYEHLSSGLRSLIAMLGDMMLRLFEQQPEVTDPAKLCGIVLIDEIDIHLHPNWQIKVPQILSENFPQIQFIVTTHSPIPLLGIPPKSKIYNISRTAEKGVSIKSLNYINIANLLPNAILTSPIFAMDDLVSVNNKDISKVNVDDNIEDTNFFNLLDRKMLELSKKEELFNKKYFS